jgi:CubicO group peptidase (beta-lactamase class C family)
VLVVTMALTAAWAMGCHRTTATTGGVGSTNAEAAAVDQLFAKWTTGGSPGCSVAISRHGTLLQQNGYGLANLDHQVPIAADTVFDAASVSKQFAAFSILLLAQRKQLSLDDDVGKHIPGWAKREQTVTIRHLVSHTSGGHDAFLLQGLAPALAAGFADQIVDILARAPGLEFPPGSRFAYNNSGYTTLARIVERISGQTFAAFTRANIFQPLGMTDSHFHDDPSRIVPRRAIGYQRDGGGFRVAVRSLTDSLVGNAGLFTTTGDLLKWEQNFVTPRVGERALLDQMMTPVVPTGWSAASRYALGLEIAEHRGLRTIGHSGGDDGRRAHVLRYPDRGLAVAVLCNLQDIDPAKLIESIAEIYLAKEFPVAAIASASAPAMSAPASAPSAVSPSPSTDLQRWVGLYHNASDEIVGRIAFLDGKLWAYERVNDDNRFELTSIGGNRFAIPSSPVVVEFLPPTASHSQQLHVTIAGRPTMVSRLIPDYTPSREQLQAFAGAYTSDEIHGIYTLTATGTGLQMDIPTRGGLSLVPVFADAFSANILGIVRFTRDGSGRVTAFTAHGPGVRGVRFTRQR